MFLHSSFYTFNINCCLVSYQSCVQFVAQLIPIEVQLKQNEMDKIGLLVVGHFLVTLRWLKHLSFLDIFCV